MKCCEIVCTCEMGTSVPKPIIDYCLSSLYTCAELFLRFAFTAQKLEGCAGRFRELSPNKKLHTFAFAES